MRGQFGDWEVSIDENVGFQVDAVGVVARQRRGNGGYAWLAGWDENGYPVLETVQEWDPANVVARSPILIPRDMVLAMAEAVKPGPAHGEVKRLEEALAVERARVERTIDAGLVPRTKTLPVVIDEGSLSPASVETIRRLLSTEP